MCRSELKPLHEICYRLSQVLGPKQLAVLDKAESK